MDVLPSGTGISLSPAGGAWQNTLNLTKLSNLFSLYPSKGDVTIAGATSLPSVLDGPGVVARFGRLTVNAALTAAINRCRFSMILCDTLTMGAAGSITMTARGAAGGKHWVHQDLLLPNNLRLSGRGVSFRDYAAWCASNGYAIFDPNIYSLSDPEIGDIQANYASWPGNGASIVSAAGCGASKSCSTDAGQVGNVGVNAPGGGGTAGYYSAWSASGRPWGGGPGSGCMVPTQSDFDLIADQYGGHGGTGYLAGTNACGGGGAGNPGGPGNTQGAYVGQRGADGTGGILIVICRGLLTLAAGHSFTANGSNGGAATPYNNNGGGGGSGGGFVGVFYGSKNATAISMTANGGSGGGGDRAGGAGGLGSTRAGLLSEMGWS